MEIYKYKTSRDFITQWIAELPNSGRGELIKIARYLKLHSSTLSQILKGDRDFSLEQAASLAGYIGLNESESRFFLLLVQNDKTTGQSLKSILKNQIQEAIEASRDLYKILPTEKKISDEEKAVFYSAWVYSGIRVLSSIEKYQTLDALEERLRISRVTLNQVVQFLISTGLCVKKNGKIIPGPQYTHLESNSPFVAQHHANWRIKAMEKQADLNKDELRYTSPMSISKKDVEKVRIILVNSIKEIQSIRAESPCEETHCLNIDWFKF